MSRPSLPPLVGPDRLTVDTAAAFRAAMLETLAAAAREQVPVIDVDLGGTTAIDAAGLGLLVLLEKRATALGARVRLFRPSPTALAVLQRSRIHLRFDVSPAA